MMLPPQVTVVPIYILWSRLHLTGTLWPLILPMLFGDAFSIFLLRQFLVTIPQEYADAARVDGCGEFRIMLRVILPMAKPGDRRGRAVPVLLRLERLLRAADLHQREPDNWTVSLGLVDVPRRCTTSSGTSRWPRRCWSWCRSIMVFFLAQRVVHRRASRSRG